MTNEEFISLHYDADVRSLALSAGAKGVDLAYCLTQIEGRQIAAAKIPSWAANAKIRFPQRLSLEQCSSEATARYKSDVVERLLPQQEQRRSMADITGGLGVDFSFISPLFARGLYVEKNMELCDLARHNFPLLGLGQDKVRVQEAEAEDCINLLDQTTDLIFVDPSRRSDSGRKVVLLSSCSPNMELLAPSLMERAGIVMVKLSPMLDISDLVRKLPHVAEVHVVSVKGECRELVAIIKGGEKAERVRCYCVNLCTSDPVFEFFFDQRGNSCSSDGVEMERLREAWLYEPNVSILKSGGQDLLQQRYGVRKLSARSNLFIAEQRVVNFPGREFKIEDSTTFAKKELKAFLKDVKDANLTVRNFPSSVAELRSRLHIREGGEVFLFATTIKGGAHVLIRARKA